MSLSSPYKKLNFALIGCGRIAERHAEHINNKGVLKAVCDIDFSKAKKIAQLYNATPYNSIEELLLHEKGIDVASITSPNGLHAHIVLHV